jgi:DNA-directed RNA polymerase subunit RPC12/RpoP
VIRFKCIYCGQRILAPETSEGKTGLCPNCGHNVRVLNPLKKQMVVSKDISEREKKAKAEIELMNAINSPDDVAELIEEKAGWFIPVYDELALFLTAITLILIYVVDAVMREQIHNWLAGHNYVWVYIMGAIFLCGLGLSVYHVFTAREKTDAEKWGMLIFAVLANAVCAIVAGLYVLKSDNARDWLLIFPVWNIINGVMLILMLRLRIIDEQCVSDRDASAGEVIFGLIAVLVLFIFCNYVFKQHWALTFSICTIYATSFDKALQSVFPRLAKQNQE